MSPGAPSPPTRRPLRAFPRIARRAATSSLWRDGPSESFAFLKRERAYYSAGVTILFAVLYFGAARYGASAEHKRVEIPLDPQIPFVAQSIWIYVSAVPLVILPAFALKSDALVRKTAISYAIALAICFTVFLTYPTTSLFLRQPLEALEPSNASEWLVHLIYGVDPPYNIFPSLHVALSVAGAMAMWRASSTFGLIGAAWVISIAVSVCTTKQHFFLDAIAGALIGIRSSLWGRRGSDSDIRQWAGYCLGGLTVWCVLTGTAYATLLVMYLQD